MNLDQSLYAHLAGTTGITQYVGTRIFPVYLPQGARLPAVVLERISSNFVRASGSDPSITESRWQVTALSTSRRTSELIGLAIRTAMRDQTSTALGDSSSGVNVHRMFLDDRRTIVTHDPQTKRPTIENSQDFIIWANEV